MKVLQSFGPKVLVAPIQSPGELVRRLVQLAAASTCWLSALCVAGLSLSACGGGGSETASPAPALASVVSGAIVDAFVVNATVSPYQVNADGSIGALIPCVPTSSCPASSDANGNYTVNLGAYAGPVLLQAGGGTYTDTVTGQTVALPSGLTLSALLPSVSPGSGTVTAEVTPFTSLAAQLALQQVSQTSASSQPVSLVTALQTSSAAVASDFGGVSNLVETQLLNLGVANCGAGASQASFDVSLLLAGASQLASNFKVTSGALYFAVLEDKTSDGALDGLVSGNPINVPLADGSGTVPLTTIYGSGLALSLKASIATFQASAANACNASLSASVGSALQNPPGPPSPSVYEYVLNGSIDGLTGTSGVEVQYVIGLTCPNDVLVGSGAFANVILASDGTFTSRIGGSPNSYAPLNYNNACGTNTWFLTVKSAPGQSCAITPETGTFTWTDSVGNQNAATQSPVISCSPILYTVGGAVSGLTSGTVQITNTADGDSVTVSANGSFTLPSQLMNGTAYDVVATPSSCAVSGGNGAIDDANVTTVLVQCAGITPITPVALNNPNGLLFASPYLYVANSGGNEVLAYQEQLDPTSHLVTGLTLVASITQNISSPTRLAMDAAGHLYVTNLGNNTVTVYDASNAGNVAANSIAQLTNMTISSGLDRPLGIAIDPATNDVYVANNAAAFPYSGSVSIYRPTTGGGFAQIGSPLTFDGTNSSFSAPGSLSIYAVGGTSYLVLALGPSSGPDSVLLYAAPLTSTSMPLFDLSNGNGCSTGPSGPTGTALFAAGSPLLYLSSFYSSSVAGYDFQSLTNTACPTPFVLSQGPSAIHQPEGIAVDGFGNVIVSNSGNNTITAYAPGAGLASAPVYTAH